jgi:hypothetical protein
VIFWDFALLIFRAFGGSGWRVSDVCLALDSDTESFAGEEKHGNGVDFELGWYSEEFGGEVPEEDLVHDEC